jgi:hypothetical protein
MPNDCEAKRRTILLLVMADFATVPWMNKLISVMTSLAKTKGPPSWLYTVSNTGVSFNAAQMLVRERLYVLVSEQGSRTPRHVRWSSALQCLGTGTSEIRIVECDTWTTTYVNQANASVPGVQEWYFTAA